MGVPHMVIRRHYMEILEKWRDKQVIKVVNGVRRCGKSTLLEQFRAALKQSGVEESQITAISFEKVESEHLLEYHALHEFAAHE